ncbi:MAG: hypothetical protein ACKOXB_13135 [Flavobacteriales bacterium]
MKKTLLLLLVLVSITATAQDFNRYLPVKPLAYARFDLAGIFANQSLDSIKKKEFFQDFVKYVSHDDSLMKVVVSDVEKFGLSLATAHWVANIEDSVLQNSVMFQINNGAELEKNINLLFPIGDSSVYYSGGSDFKLYIYNGLYMAWDKEVFIIGASRPLYNFHYLGAWDLTPEQMDLDKKMLNERASKGIHKIFHANTAASKKYLKDMYKDASVALFFDVESVYNIYFDFMRRGMRGLWYGADDNMFLMKNKVLNYANSEVNMGIYFNNDELLIKGKSKIGKELRKKIAKVYNRKYTGGIFDYVPANAIFSSGMRVNTEAYINFTFDALKDMYENMPRYGHYAANAVVLIQTFLDEKGMGELMRGDVLFNINSVDKINVTYTTYNYDEEYNATEVTDVKQVNVPSFSVIGSTGNPKQLKILFDLGLGISDHYVKEKDVYVFRDNDFNEIGGALYIRITKKFYFFSNDSNFIYKIVPEGGYKNSLGGKARRHHKSRSFYLDFDAQKLLRSMMTDSSEIAFISEHPMLASAAGKLTMEHKFALGGSSYTIKYKTSDKTPVLPFLTELIDEQYRKEQARHSYYYNEYDDYPMADSTAVMYDTAVAAPDYYYDENGNVTDSAVDVAAPAEEMPNQMGEESEMIAPATEQSEKIKK